MNMNYLKNPLNPKLDFYLSQMNHDGPQMYSFKNYPEGYHDYSPWLCEPRPKLNLKKNDHPGWSPVQGGSRLRSAGFNFKADFRGPLQTKEYRKNKFKNECNLEKFKDSEYAKIGPHFDIRPKKRVSPNIPARPFRFQRNRNRFRESGRPGTNWLDESFNGLETFNPRFSSFKCSWREKRAHANRPQDPRRRTRAETRAFCGRQAAPPRFGEPTRAGADPSAERRRERVWTGAKRNYWDFLDERGEVCRESGDMGREKWGGLTLSKKYLIGNEFDRENNWFRIYKFLLESPGQWRKKSTRRTVERMLTNELRKLKQNGGKGFQKVNRCVSAIVKGQRADLRKEQWGFEMTKRGHGREFESPLKGMLKVNLLESYQSDLTNENDATRPPRFNISKIELGSFPKHQLKTKNEEIGQDAKAPVPTQKNTPQKPLFRRSKRLMKKKLFNVRPSLERSEESMHEIKREARAGESQPKSSKKSTKKSAKRRQSCEQLSRFSDPEPEAHASVKRKSQRISMQKKQKSRADKDQKNKKAVQTRYVNIRQIKRGTRDYKRISKFFALPLNEVIHNDDIFDDVSEVKPSQLRWADVDGPRAFSKYHRVDAPRVQFGVDSPEPECEKQVKSRAKKIRKNGKLVFEIKQNFGVVCSVQRIEELKAKFKGVKRLKTLIQAKDADLARHLLSGH